ncbi:hypothetical protein [Candidatus Leptofilum sp.]|uniref:hypothetical protein n=1 Tax=Candidatus Leptofilum sp. TaxID=3241576 RepID=UPI003B5B141B
MSKPLDRCPSCLAIISGVKCNSCSYVGGKSEFISNNHRCPKCNSIVRVPGVPRLASPGLGMAILGTVLGLLDLVFPFLCFISLPLCIFVALKAKEQKARIVAYIGIAINFVPFFLGTLLDAFV